MMLQDGDDTEDLTINKHTVTKATFTQLTSLTLKTIFGYTHSDYSTVNALLRNK